MMTVLNEVKFSKKYDHLVLVEYYEWVARVAFKYYDRKKAALTGQDEHITDFRHE